MAATGACGGEQAPVGGAVRVDSAGVEIVTSERPLHPSGGLVVADQPDMEIGARQGDPSVLLDGVVGASQLPGGDLLVCNAGDRTLRIFGPGGAHRVTAGGEGGGPGELRFLIRCFVGSDGIRVLQVPLQPIQRYGLDGAYLGSEPAPLLEGAPAQVLERLADGTLIQHRGDPVREAPQGVSVQHTTVYLNRSGAVVEVASMPLRRLVRQGTAFSEQSFAPSLRVVALGDGFAMAWPATFDVGVYAPDGTLLRRVRRPLATVPVARAWIADWEEQILEAPPGGGDRGATPEQIVAMMEHPSELPAHHRLLGDAAGRLWVERADGPRPAVPWVRDTYPGPTTWDVFDPSGAWLATVALPESFDPLEIGRDYVLGVHRDDLGVERVRSYRLEG